MISTEQLPRQRDIDDVIDTFENLMTEKLTKEVEIRDDRDRACGYIGSSVKSPPVSLFLHLRYQVGNST